MSCLDRGIPLSLDNKISRPSVSFMVKGTQLKFSFLYGTPPVAAAVLYARESKLYTNIYIINIYFPKWA